MIKFIGLFYGNTLSEREVSVLDKLEVEAETKILNKIKNRFRVKFDTVDTVVVDGVKLEYVLEKTKAGFTVTVNNVVMEG